MILSVITINLNNKSGLRQTIKSVVSQTAREIFEYIVIDGESTDGSAEVINEYKNFIDKIIIEKDHGIYDAMNKGIKNANGDYLLFLNSADTLYNSHVISNIKKYLENNIDLCYGDLIFGDRILIYPDKIGVDDFFKTGEDTLGIPHNATFIHKRMFAKKLYDDKQRCASDWTHFMTCILHYKCTLFHIPEKVTIYDRNGYSSVNNKKCWHEIYSFLRTDYPSYLKNMDINIKKKRFPFLFKKNKPKKPKSKNKFKIPVNAWL